MDSSLCSTFSMPECAKTHLQQCRISKYFRGGPRGPPLSGGGPPDPPGRGGEGKGEEGKGGEGKEGEKGEEEGKA